MTAKRYYCAVELAVDVIGGKWKPVILAHLKEGVHRYGELRRRMPGVSEKMLTQQLRELEADGIVSRTSRAGRVPHVEYDLTAEGAKLGPALTALYEWGENRAAARGVTFEEAPDAGVEAADVVDVVAEVADVVAEGVDVVEAVAWPGKP